MLQGVLFDMDGVLFDTERLYREVDRAVAKEMGFAISDELYRSQIGLNEAEVRRTFEEGLGPAFDYPLFKQKMWKLFQHRLGDEGVPVKPGVPELLRWLKENGWKIAVASSTIAERVADNLRSTGLIEYFDAVVGGDMVSASKPAPDIFLYAAKALGLEAGQCAAIEDSFNGVRAAAAAGCVTIMVPDILPPDEELRTLLDAELPSLHEAAAFLARYNAEHRKQ